MKLLIETLEARTVLSVVFFDKETKDAVANAYKDRIISRDELVSIFRQTTDQNVITANELSDLRKVTTLNMPEHVRYLAKDVVFANIANAKFQGNALGNLTANSPGQKINNLIDKWFYGKDHPALPNNLSYKEINLPLFDNGATSTDVAQGQLGTCYFLASLAAVADKLGIKSSFIDNNDRTWTIRLYDLNGLRKVDYITVDNYLPVDVNGSSVYAHFDKELWVALIEKAYAQYNETGGTWHLDKSNSYQAIVGGYPVLAMESITGVPTKCSWFYDVKAQTTLNKSIYRGDAIAVTANLNDAPHAYYLKSYSNGIYYLFNPWGFDHLEVTWDQLKTSANFVIEAK
jgi:hypothetical protein